MVKNDFLDKADSFIIKKRNDARIKKRFFVVVFVLAVLIAYWWYLGHPVEAFNFQGMALILFYFVFSVIFSLFILWAVIYSLKHLELANWEDSFKVDNKQNLHGAYLIAYLELNSFNNSTKTNHKEDCLSNLIEASDTLDAMILNLKKSDFVAETGTKLKHLNEITKKMIVNLQYNKRSQLMEMLEIIIKGLEENKIEVNFKELDKYSLPEKVDYKKKIINVFFGLIKRLEIQKYEETIRLIGVSLATIVVLSWYFEEVNVGFTITTITVAIFVERIVTSLKKNK